jgi:hypothetical protein
MDFQLSEEHIMIQKAARDFAVTECLPVLLKGMTCRNFPENRLKSLPTWFYGDDGKA